MYGIIQILPIHFPKWESKGITHLHHLSFHTIVQKCGVERDQFLHYQQLKAIIKTKINKK